jgi:site-specific DNA recombinase
MSENKRVHVYTRVSSQAQEDNTSLGTQEAACRTWAAERSLPVASVAHEVWSGGDRHRPQLDALLDRLTPGDVVLAYALDRLSRSQVDTAILIDRIEGAGASLALVTEDFERSAVGTFLRNAKAFVAELEREKIAERTQRGKRARAAAGKPLPGARAPYGYLWADSEKTRLVRDEPHARVVREIFDLFLSGLPLRAVATRLEERGIPSPTGKERWLASSVRHILTHPVYTGSHVAYRERLTRLGNGNGQGPKYSRRTEPSDEWIVIPDVAPAIVSTEELAAVAERLAHNKTNAVRNNRSPEATLLRSGHIVCGHCGWSLMVRNSPNRSSVYTCRSRIMKAHDCPQPGIAASLIDGPVWQRLTEILRDPAIIAAELARQRTDGGLDEKVAAMERHLTGLADKQTRVARAIAAVNDDDAATPLIAELKSLAEQKKAVERERDALVQRIADRDEEAAQVQSFAAWCQTVAANLDTLTYDEKRLALHALGVQVRVWTKNARDEAGEPLPRWDLQVRLLTPSPSLVSYTTRRRRSRRAGSSGW